jgi:hypothetical protein
MSGKNYDNFGYHFGELQENLDEIIQDKNIFKQKLRDFIFSFQMIDSRIEKSIFLARDFFLNQRNYYKQKIEWLRQKKSKNQNLWNRLTKELNSIDTPKLDHNIIKEIGFLNYSIKDIKFKISQINEQLETLSLDINTENELIEKLVKLQSEEKNKTDKLMELEKSQENKYQNSRHFQIKRKIESLEFKLTENYNDILKWSNRLLFSHKKMLNLYRTAREFEIIKSRVSTILSDNKDASIYYNQLYLDLIDENYKAMLEELLHLKENRKPRIFKEKTEPDVKKIIKKRRYSKNVFEQKLAKALAKQKSGKRLDFYELKLILDSKKRRK